MITMAEKVFPGLRECTEAVEVSTPLTNMRYAGAMGGSIYGFNQPLGQHGVANGSSRAFGRALFCRRMDPAWRGFEPCMMSGKWWAERFWPRSRSGDLSAFLKW